MAREHRVRGEIGQGGPQEPLGVVEVLLELDRVVDAVVATRVELIVLHALAVLEVQHARAFDEAVGHHRARRDDGVHPAPVDHLAQHQPLLGDRHRARHRDHAEAVRVVHHGLEDVGRLAEAPAAERGVRHRADQRIDAVEGRHVERRQGFEAIVVAGSVAVLVALVGHLFLCSLPCRFIFGWSRKRTGHDSAVRGPVRRSAVGIARCRGRKWAYASDRAGGAL